ncbi:MAG: Glucose/sorbosone dehydrogenase-like protein [Verrucomicrobiales bacterium]|nr:Glucose/sorbosone dehydrogenase-like protein [Verrucomicrobiales bacterium]
MKLHTNHLLVLCFVVFFGALNGDAATIWNGPLITFTQPASDPTQAANQDQLTPNVSLTRAVNAGMFNGVTESSYTHNVSPADTEWAVGALADYATLTYSDWETAGGGRPVHNLPGQQLVLHLISEDIYLSLKFTYLGGGFAGGFTYDRSTPAAANVPPTVSITSPTNGASFTAPASVPITATANDSDGSVANVSFFDGSILLGGTNNTPYTITASLATGSHALTAVATDNLGLSATSSVVNVTVSSGNTPPSVTITNPVENSIFGNTDRVTIGASASDSDGSVTNLQLFNGAVLLRNFTTGPYTFQGTAIAGNFALGTNTVTAVATDNLGVTTTSAPVHVIIARYLPPLTNGNIAILLQLVATNMAAPDYAINPPGDRTRLFVVEQNGLLRVIQNGTLLPEPALDIQSRVQPPLVATNRNDERGFLGLAFHPGYTNASSPGYRTLYTYNSEMIPPATSPTYPVPTTATNAYKNVVNEWKISGTNASVVDPTSRREIISFGKTAGNHNGGTVAFGPDGYLYLALGDGGDANDVGASHIEPGGNAQNLSTPLGKFLRFDPLLPSLTAGSGNPISSNGQYRIPTSNPFQGPGQVPEIYCYGMRNPYRFCFDRVTGDLIHADVGQNNIEEIDRIILGGNYGWPIKEGDYLFNRTNAPSGLAGTIGAFPGNRSPGSPAGLIDPISGPMGTLEYDHNEGISITGGFVYRGTAIPELVGKYVFGDLALKTAPVRADGRLFYADLQTGKMNAFPLFQFGGSAVLPNGLTVHGFGEDADGELYALVTNGAANGTGGLVYKLAPLRLTAQVSGNTLDISWPAAGGRLQAQTTGLGTNWVTVPNSTATNHVVAPISPANGSVFYRLAVP